MNHKARNKEKAQSVAILWTDNAWDDYIYWQNEDKKIVEEINRLLEECRRHPFNGTGKPEPLKGNLTGYWSRRITKVHRLVYAVTDRGISVMQCRFHYE